METSSPEDRNLPRLHIVTNDELLGSQTFPAVAEEVLNAGGERVALHIRGRTLSGREIWSLTVRAVAVARRTGSWIFVNDRIDVALACDADGVQLGRGSIDVATAQRIAGKSLTIGASIHDLHSAREAADAGADFLLAGTLFDSRSHPNRAGSGCAWLTDLTALGVPIIGIGGITPGRVAEARRAGAQGVAVISGIWGSVDPAEEVERYLVELGG